LFLMGWFGFCRFWWWRHDRCVWAKWCCIIFPDYYLYDIERRDRPKDPHGGVLIAAKKQLQLGNITKSKDIRRAYTNNNYDWYTTTTHQNKYSRWNINNCGDI
jgi:hypothetical protein